MSERPLDLVLAARLSIHPNGDGGCRIEPDGEHNFQILNQDEIHMVRSLEEGRSMTLLLELGGEYGASICGLSFGETSDEALRAEPRLDTAGGYYAGSPFKFSPGPDGSALLTVVNDPAENCYRGGLWFFDIWPAGKGPIHRIDPKIYNKGDGDDRPRPGETR